MYTSRMFTRIRRWWRPRLPKPIYYKPTHGEVGTISAHAILATPRLQPLIRIIERPDFPPYLADLEFSTKLGEQVYYCGIKVCRALKEDPDFVPAHIIRIIGYEEEV